MGTLVGVVMAVLLITLVVQAATAEAAVWVSAVSIAAAAAAIGLAMARVFPRAGRLGERSQPQAEQSEIARSIFRDHVLCLAAMVTLLGVQLAAA
jgi:formate hydrogenlyase subunit 3/multisubunit Na+/H+ antiporter MnhD subunit